MKLKHNRFLALIIAAVLLIFQPGFAAASPQTDCISILLPHIDTVKAQGLRPSVYLAQAVLETGWCRSEAVRHNNYWGIKCRGGLCFSKVTWEVYDSTQWSGVLQFQAFNNLAEGTQAYIDKINKNPIYRDVDRTTKETYIDTLARHWATDPDYKWKLRNIINNWGLDKYDEIEPPNKPRIKARDKI